MISMGSDLEPKDKSKTMMEIVSNGNGNGNGSLPQDSNDKFIHCVSNCEDRNFGEETLFEVGEGKMPEGNEDMEINITECTISGMDRLALAECQDALRIRVLLVAQCLGHQTLHKLSDPGGSCEKSKRNGKHVSDVASPTVYCIGRSPVFSMLRQFEFYHREFPKTMSSIGDSLFFLSMALAHVLSSANIVNHTISRDGKPSWVANNLDEARLDCY